MNKKLLTILFLIGSLFLNNAYANTVTTTTTTNTTLQNNVTNMRTQINSIQSKLNTISEIHRTNVDNLLVNLLPIEQVNAYKQELQSLNGESTLQSLVNFDICDYATNKLNKYLNTAEAKTKLANLTTSQKTAIKKDLNNLKTVQTSYAQVVDQTKELLKNAKSDPMATILLKDDISNLISSQKRIFSQTKNITKLTSNLNKTTINAGLSLN